MKTLYVNGKFLSQTTTGVQRYAAGVVEAVGPNVRGLRNGDEVLGSAKMGPNRPARGAHIATASFMVNPSGQGRGVGRACGGGGGSPRDHRARAGG